MAKTKAVKTRAPKVLTKKRAAIKPKELGGFFSPILFPVRDFYNFLKSFYLKHKKLSFGILSSLVFLLLAISIYSGIGYFYKQALVIKNTHTVALQQIVAGQPVKLVTLVDANQIKNGKRLVEIPKNATGISVRKVTPLEVRDIITGNYKLQHSSNTAVKSRGNVSWNVLLKNSSLAVADLSDAGDSIAQTIISSTDNTQLVDVSGAATDSQPAPTPTQPDATQPSVVQPAQPDTTQTPTTPTTPDVSTADTSSTPTTPADTTPTLPTSTTDTTSPSTDSTTPTQPTTPDQTQTQDNSTQQPCQGSATDNCIAVQYTTPAPTIQTSNTSQGQQVTISAQDETTPLTDVLAFTTIPHIFKVGEESKIQIKWKNNGNQNVSFHAYDKDNDGYLDYVEWTVPHLSTQIFDIIFISKAFQLDSNQNIVADIYPQVEAQDGNYASLTDGQYVRFTFQSALDDTRNIDIYTRPTDSSSPASIQVYPVYTDSDGNQTEGQLVATFPTIDHEDTYHASLANLGSNTTDVFDFKIIGNVDLDYVQDGASTCTSTATGNWNDPTKWSCVGGDTYPQAGDTATIVSPHNITMNTAGAVGTLTVNSGGTLTTAGGNALTISGDLTVNGTIASGGSITLSGASNTVYSTTGGTISSNIVLSASYLVDVSPTYTLVMSGTISGVGYGLTKNNSGALTLSNNTSTYTGGTTLNSGTLNINNINNSGTQGPLGNGAFTINGGTIDNTSGASKAISSSITAITIGGDFAFSTSAGTANNNLSLNGAVSLGADRTVTLNGLGALTFSGTLTNTSDSVRTITVNNGAGTGATSSLTLSGGYNLTGPGSTGARNDVITGSGNTTISGTVANGTTAGSGLTKNGSGTLALTGGSGNSYTGPTTISGGILSCSYNAWAAGSNSCIGASSNAAGNLVFDGGTLRYVGGNPASDLSRSFTLTNNGGTIDINSSVGFNPVIDNYGWIIGNSGGGSAMACGATTGPRTLTLTNSGTGTGGTFYVALSDCTGGATSLIVNNTGGGVNGWDLFGTHTYSGATTVNNGILYLGATQNSQTTVSMANSAVTLANTSGVQLSLRSTIATIGSLAGGGTNGGNVSAAQNGFQQAPQLTTNGNNANTTFNGAITDDSNNNFTLIKAGTGTLTLGSNANTYQNTTTVNAGTLSAANTSGSATGTSTFFTVGGASATDTPTLTGTGIISTSPTISGTTTAGTISGTNDPTSTNKLTLSNGLTLSSGSKSSFNLSGAPSTTAIIAVTGGTLSSGGNTITIPTATQAGTYHVFSSGTTLSSGFSIAGSGNAAGYSYAVAYDNSGATKYVNVVVTSSNTPPTGSFASSPTQKTNGSGNVDVSITVNDAEHNNCKAKIQLSTLSDCSSIINPHPTLISPATGATYTPLPDVTTANAYQIGTTTPILTTGANTVTFDWDSKTDLPSATGSLNYYLCLIANDGTVDQTTMAKSSAIPVDNTAPTITSTAPATNAYIKAQQASYTLSEAAGSGTIVFTRTGGTADGNVHTCTLQGTALNSGAHSNLTLATGANACVNWANALVDGSIYTITFNAADSYGNAATTVTNTGVTYDITAPTQTPVAPATNAYINNTTTTVSINNSETIGSGTITVTHTGGTADSGHTCTLIGTGLTSGAHTINFADTTNGCAVAQTLVDGAIYTFAFDATDLAGNLATTVSNTGVTFDTTPPNAATALVWAETSPHNSTSVNANWTKSNSGDLADQKIQFYSDGTCTVTSGALIDLSSNSLQTYNFTLGTNGNTYTYKITSIDNATNSTVSGCSSSMLIDTTPPNAATALVWAETSPHNSTSVNANWTKSNSGDLADQKIQFYSDGTCTVTSGALIDLSSNSLQTYNFTLGTDGNTYTYKITSIDNATNSTVSGCSSSMLIDTTPPNAATGLGWAETSPHNSTSVNANWTKSNSGDLADQKIQFYSDGTCTVTSGALIDLSSNSLQTYNFTLGTNGNTYTYKITSIDNATNSTVSGCSSSMYINSAPTFTSVSDVLTPYFVGDVITFNTVASDPDAGDTVTLYVCKANDFNGSTCGAGGEWCDSSLNAPVATNPSCTYSLVYTDAVGSHNYFAYLVDNHGLQATNNSINQSFTVTNTLPIASGVSINSGAGSVTPIEGTTQNVTCSATVSDDNGYSDLTNVTAKFYRSGVGAGASDDNSNHYTLSGLGNCSGSGTSGTCTFTFAVEYYADPTDSGTYAAQNWNCQVTPTDHAGDGTPATSIAGGIEMNTLQSFSLSTGTIGYGPVAPGQSPLNPAIETITNTGNVAMGIQVSGTDLTYSTFPHIPVGNEQYKLSNFVYGGGTALTITPTDAGASLVKPTQSTPAPAQNTYWQILVPYGTHSASYSGTISFAAD